MISHREQFLIFRSIELSSGAHSKDVFFVRESTKTSSILLLKNVKLFVTFGNDREKAERKRKNGET
jgi:hypothetical protein